jgi:hypothetical protein
MSSSRVFSLGREGGEGTEPDGAVSEAAPPCTQIPAASTPSSSSVAASRGDSTACPGPTPHSTAESPASAAARATLAASQPGSAELNRQSSKGRAYF